MDTHHNSHKYKNIKTKKRHRYRKRREDNHQRQLKKTNRYISVNETINPKISAKNVTTQRLTMKHGLFAKGVRTETFMRSNLSEEFIARSEGNLHKIIDLANGRPTSSSDKRNYNDINKFNIITTQVQSRCNTPILDLQNTPIIQNKATTSYLCTSEKENLQPDLINSEKIINENAPRLLKRYFRDDTLESMVEKLKTDLKQLNINTDKHQRYKNNMDINRLPEENNVQTEVILNPLKYLESVQKRNILKKRIGNGMGSSNMNSRSDSIINAFQPKIPCRMKNLEEKKRKKIRLHKNFNFSESDDSDEIRSSFTIKTPEIRFYPRKLI